MIKLLLKHAILNECVDVFFNRLIIGMARYDLRNSNILISHDTDPYTMSTRIVAQWGDRKITANYTLEMAQDLSSIHGINVEEHLIEAIKWEIYSEVGIKPKGVSW